MLGGGGAKSAIFILVLGLMCWGFRVTALKLSADELMAIGVHALSQPKVGDLQVSLWPVRIVLSMPTHAIAR